MQPTAPDAERRIDALLAEFMAQPLHPATFAELEGLLLAAAETDPDKWGHLAGVYECRSQALGPGSEGRVELLIKLGAVLDEHLGAPKAALRRYREARGLDPRHPAALAALRRALTRGSEWTEALLIAEDEERLPLPPAQRAETLAEIAALWSACGEARQARDRYEAALSLDPTCDAALLGLAELAQASGAPAVARTLLERRLARLGGTRRAEAQEQLAALLPERDSERIRALLWEAVQVEPPRRSALERLLALEEREGAWDRVDRLHQRLFVQLVGEEAIDLALAAAAAQLERPGSLEGAVEWTAQALDLAPADPRVHRLRADLFRRTGQLDALCESLEALERTEGPAAERSREIAELHERAGRHEAAAAVLAERVDQEPGDRAALAALERCHAALGHTRARIDVIERQLAVARSDEERAWLHTREGELWLELGAQPEAEQAFRDALQRWPQAAAPAERLQSLLQGDARAGELAELLEQLARGASGAAAAGRWSALGRHELERRGRPELARDAFRSALECDRGSLEALAGLRAAAARMGDLSLVLEACEHELALAPELGRARELLRERMAVARELGDLPRARETAQRWAEREPIDEPFAELAAVCREAGDADGEREALEQLEALAASPESRARCLERLAELALAGTDADSLERALACYRRALELAPTPALRARYIDLLRGGGPTAELAAQLRALLPALGPDASIAVRLDLARVLADLGETLEARQVLEPAFESAPANGEVAALLERVLGELGETGAFAALLRRRLAHALDPQESRALACRLGQLLIDSLGRPLEAAELLQAQADPVRREPLEELYERALAAAGAEDAALRWWLRRESCSDGAERGALLLRIAAQHRREGRNADAIAALRRADRLAPDVDFDALRRPLLALVRAERDVHGQLEVLAELARDAADPATRAAFFLERARLWIEELGNPVEGLRELELLPSGPLLRSAELRLQSALARRVGAQRAQAQALEALAERADDRDEKIALWLELAALYVAGPDEVRDAPRGERLLRRIVGLEPGNAAALDRLSELLERDGRPHELAALLRERAAAEPSAELREGLALRLAHLLIGLDDLGGALTAARRELERNPQSAALAQFVARALERSGDRDAQREFFADRAERAREPAERARWLRRQLHALETGSGRDAALLEERLAAIAALLELEPDDAALRDRQLRLQRELGPGPALADALEAALGAGELASPTLRRILVRELLELCELRLGDPARALRAVERELARGERDPELRLRAASYAEQLGDAEREAALLLPLVEGAQAAPVPDPRALRRMAHSCLRSGDEERAQRLLWQLLDLDRGDREALAELEPLVLRSGDTERKLELLELRHAGQSGEQRHETCRLAFELAEKLRDGGAALRWLRRWQALETPPRAALERRLALEQALGDRLGALESVRALRSQAADAPARAVLWHTESQLQRSLGQQGLARECLESALRETGTAPLRWLEALLSVQDQEGRPREQLETLQRLAVHVDASPAERRRFAEERIALLAGQPDQRELAARELEELMQRDSLVDSTRQRERLETLLELCAALGRDPQWCRAVERLIPLCDPERAARLRRERARRLEQPLGARDAAVAAWREVLAATPSDSEALQALARLFAEPGSELPLAETLEQLAATAGDADLWYRAAQLRFTALGAAKPALADLERARALAPERRDVHALRARVCAQLGELQRELESLRSVLLAEHKSADGAASDPQGEHDAHIEPDPHGEPDAQEIGPLWLRLAELRAGDPDGRDEAERGVREALRLAPADLAVLRSARLVLERLGDLHGAARLLREELARGVRPEERIAGLRQLARILWDELREASDSAEVLEELAGLAELEPEDRARWAGALGALGRWPESIRQQLLALQAREARAGAEHWIELAELALAHDCEIPIAEAACAEARSRAPGSARVWAVQVRLHDRAGRWAEEVEASLQWSDRLESARESAAALAHAAELCRTRLADPTRAETLFLDALHRDGSWLPALVAAGELALARRDLPEAERRFSVACALLRDAQPESPAVDALGRAAEPLERGRQIARWAGLAAQAAREMGHTSDALRHLETALLADPHDGAALESLTSLCLELGSYERARSCVQSLLDSSESAEQRVPLWVQLARACEEMGDLASAVAALEKVLEQQPDDEAARARAIGLLERLGETDRALGHVAAWTSLAAAQFQPSLRIRAAQIEAAAGRKDAARARLEQLLQEDAALEEAWLELASLVRADGGPAAALEVSERALASARGERIRANLLWLQADALRELRRLPEAAQRARDVLALEPGRLEAAELLARNLGHAGDWADAAHKLEAALAPGTASPALAAEIFEAIGRAYAGPLENVERAASAYRSALAANPLRQSASEALADVTVFDPRTHRESVQLHRQLLEAFPARAGSWRALRRIADHAQREGARDTCDAVLAALGGVEAQAPAPPLLVYTGRPASPAVIAASEYLRACEQADCLPVEPGENPWAGLPEPVREELARLAGRAWALPDAQVARLWREAASGERDLASDAPRRMRRRLREAQSAETRILLRDVGADVWRQQVIAEAASKALAVGRVGLRECLLAVLSAWPQTAPFDARVARDLPALIQACPPAGAVLQRVADAVLAALPV